MTALIGNQKNVKNAHFSSVKWGGTPGGEVTDFKKTMKKLESVVDR